MCLIVIMHAGIALYYKRDQNYEGTYLLQGGNLRLTLGEAPRFEAQLASGEMRYHPKNYGCAKQRVLLIS